MSDTPKHEVGSIGWVDLIITHAEEVRQFYNEVVGWKHEAVKMSDYSDFTMIAPATGRRSCCAR